MKTKLFLVLICVIGLFSCSNNIATGKIITKPYVVCSIESFEGKLCKYNLSTGVIFIGYKNDISVVDSVGKFAIGDSIQMLMHK